MSKLVLIEEYTIELQNYHGDIFARLIYIYDGETFESALFKVGEINDIINFWQNDMLLGSFGYHPLAEYAKVTYTEKKV